MFVKEFPRPWDLSVQSYPPQHANQHSLHRQDFLVGLSALRTSDAFRHVLANHTNQLSAKTS